MDKLNYSKNKNLEAKKRDYYKENGQIIAPETRGIIDDSVSKIKREMEKSIRKKIRLKYEAERKKVKERMTEDKKRNDESERRAVQDSNALEAKSSKLKTETQDKDNAQKILLDNIRKRVKKKISNKSLKNKNNKDNNYTEYKNSGIELILKDKEQKSEYIKYFFGDTERKEVTLSNDENEQESQTLFDEY